MMIEVEFCDIRKYIPDHRIGHRLAVERDHQLIDIRTIRNVFHTLNSESSITPTAPSSSILAVSHTTNTRCSLDFGTSSPAMTDIARALSDGRSPSVCTIRIAAVAPNRS